MIMPKDLESLSKKELIDLAKRKDIKMPYLYRKDELVKLIQQKERPAPIKLVKPRGPAANRISHRRTRSSRTKEKNVSTTKPYYEPTYYEETPQTVPAETLVSPTCGELPYSYNETKIVLMSRDPYWAFSYWDLSETTMLKVKDLLREHYGNIKPILRVYDVTDVDFNGRNAHRSYDVDIYLEARNWYLNIGVPNRSYLVDLGLLDGEGNFYLIARSNVIRTPRDCPSDVVDEEWMAVDFEEIYALSGGFGLGLSSHELKEKKKKLFEQLMAAPGSGVFSGSIAIGGDSKKDKQKDFFLQVATELIVYGRTMPDARVTVSGEVVRLRSDGTFSLRYFLPDEEKHLPIQAVSADEDDTRKVSIRVRKDTSSD